ncbi:hypothetical protein EMIHUDRAFT_448976 [Emiliania huxleyi CCMP1516]|uniref:Cullin family profile domain-containing protein n=2 Tax=Emiliania huxleyi TaxID=2903 RepID=A0A0D3KQN6_EMIH1|nr:hypothetical protein EMIHUDRAFT_448976 [Emiliania huxleyi CCMP1516]EOD38071.1 hypothetical protein EMIHUDRAFT_448976 [Emiliania huxleyi CCMP1516]|eukprot:XP_005790500.1 hypothetical protein EMIHUDRAFT_448976 [Emiliania huxleyi CCMP1516]
MQGAAQGATAQRVPKRLLDDVWRVRATDDDCCAICLEAPAQPLILLCGHMFCLDCFQTYATHAREYDDECTRCPTCRSPHAPPPVGQVEAEQVERGDALLARAMRMDRSRPNFLPLLEGATRFYVAALDLHPYCSRAHAMIGWCRKVAGEDSLDAFEDSARACHGALPAFAIVTLWNQTILDWLGESESAQRIELVRAGVRACSWPQAVQREAAGTELPVAENAYRKACSAFEDLTLPRVRELLENLLAHYHRMVELFSLVPIYLPLIANIVRKRITDAGLALVKKQSANAEGDLMAYVQELLDLDGVYSEIIGSTPGEGYFNGDATFLKAAREAFEVFVNKDIGMSATAELLSTFCDNLLKNAAEEAAADRHLSSDPELRRLYQSVVGGGALSTADFWAQRRGLLRAAMQREGLSTRRQQPTDAESSAATAAAAGCEQPEANAATVAFTLTPAMIARIFEKYPRVQRSFLDNDKLEKVVRLFGYLSDKDIFVEFYRKQLAKRLLLARSVGASAERSMIAKLKLRCGAQFTSKLEGMVTDMNLSQDIQSAFAEHVKDKELELDTDLTVQVLTTGFWPQYKSDELKLPKEMLQCVETFKAFYDSHTSHRRLRWVHSLGSATVVGKFTASGKSKEHDLLVSTYQACILLLFNEADSMTFSDIQGHLNLPAEELKRYVLSLCGGKYKILTKDPAGREVAPTDTLSCNATFSDRHQRIKVPMIAPKMTQEEKDAALKQAELERKHVVEWAIIKVMMREKRVEHEDLAEQAQAWIRTRPSTGFHMARDYFDAMVVDLIRREYLEPEAPERPPGSGSFYKYLA